MQKRSAAQKEVATLKDSVAEHRKSLKRMKTEHAKMAKHVEPQLRQHDKDYKDLEEPITGAVTFPPSE